MTFEDRLRQMQGILEITFPFLSLVKQAKSFEEVEQYVLVFKRKAKYQRCRLALVHHPDKGGDEKQMKVINHAFEFIDNLKIERPAPKPQHVYTYSGATTTTSSTWTGGYYYSY